MIGNKLSYWLVICFYYIKFRINKKVGVIKSKGFKALKLPLYSYHPFYQR